MIKLGITGGIGSGKSVLASILQLHGIPVYLADVESKKLTVTSPVIKKKLITLLGKNIYTDEGLNKKLLASLIFNNPNYLREVNAIIHPEVNLHFQKWTKNQSTHLCAIESAILFESGFNNYVDKVVMVYAPVELRIERALLRDKAPRDEIIRRIHNQLSDEIKKERADYIIYNNDKQALLPQTERLLSILKPEDR